MTSLSFEEQFLQSLPPEYRNNEALKESLRTSDSFAKFKESRQKLSRNDVAAWAQSGSNMRSNKNNKSQSKNSTSSKKDQKSSSSKTTTSNEEMSTTVKTAVQFKSAGNKFFVGKKFESAVKSYTRGVEILLPWQSKFNGGAPKKRLSKMEASTMVAILSNRAACYLKLERFQKSVEDCTNVLTYDSKHIKALYRRSEGYRAMSKYKLAKKDLIRLLELEPNNKSGRTGLKELLQIINNQKLQEENEKINASLSSGACVALVNLLNSNNNNNNNNHNVDTQQKAALKTFSSEIGSMLNSIQNGIGNEFFTSGLDVVLLDLISKNALEDNSIDSNKNELPRLGASVFKGFYGRLYLLMDEAVPADGTPHFFGSEYLGLRSHFRALVKTSLTGNKHQLVKVREFVKENKRSISWMWVANSYRETCSRIRQKDTNGAFVHAFESQILRAAFLNESDTLFDNMIQQGGLKQFLLEKVQVRLKQFAVVSALLALPEEDTSVEE